MIISLPVPTSDPSFLGGFCHEDSIDLGPEYEMSMESKYGTNAASKTDLISVLF